MKKMTKKEKSLYIEMLLIDRQRMISEINYLREVLDKTKKELEDIKVIRTDNLEELYKCVQ